MIRLLADEQFDMRVVDILRRRHGHEIVTVRQTCESKYGDGIDDRAVLEQALAERRILLTDNRRDFIRLHAEMPWHGGIVLCPAYVNPRRKADLIHETIRETVREIETKNLTGRLMSIPSESAITKSPPQS